MQVEKSVTARPFQEVGNELRRGVFMDELGDNLQALVKAVTESGKGGKMVIEISVEPASKGQSAVKIKDQIKIQLPKVAAGETIMFVTPDNNIVANDPRQNTRELRFVEEDAREVKAA